MQPNHVSALCPRFVLAVLVALAVLGAACSVSLPESTLLVDEDESRSAITTDALDQEAGEQGAGGQGAGERGAGDSLDVEGAEQTDQDSVDAAASVSRSDLPGPAQNLDHWHAVYGVYSCNRLGEGSERYLPAFASNQDDTGIHSHGDGVIHIHPFFQISSGKNATVALWFSEMNVEISTERINVNNQFDEFVTLVAGDECADGTGPAEIRMLQWDEPFDPAAPPPPPDNVFTQDLSSVRFVADSEVFVIAYANESAFADLPAPPADRFATLTNVTPVIEFDSDE